MADPIKDYLAAIGKRGGEAGKGKAKRRPPEHYRKMVEARKAKREKK